MNRTNLLPILTVLLGIFFLTGGIWGLFSTEVFGTFRTNRFNATIQIILGISALVSATKGASRGFLKFLGILLILVGVLWFIGTGAETLVRILNVNRTVAFFNIGIGALALILANTIKSTQPHHQNSVDIIF
jgi:hypothetical protein